MKDDDPGAFDDFADDPDDGDAVELYADELAAAVEAFGVPVLERGGDSGAPS